MFQYTPYALLTFGASLASLLTGILVWQRRPGTGITALFFMLNAIAFWSLVNTIELLVSTPSLKLLLTYLSYISTVSIPAVWIIFILQYTGREKWLTPRGIRLLVHVAVIIYLIIITNSLHGLFYTEVGSTTEDGLVALVLAHGPAFWAHTVYAYLLLLSGTILLIQTLIRSPQLYRGQVLWMLIGTFTPWLANIAYIFNISPLPKYVDITPLAFTITGAAYTWSMYRYRLMDIVPVAKDVIIDNLVSSIIVLDLNNRIVEANSKAIELIGKSANEVIGYPAAVAVSSQPGLVSQFRDTEQVRDEITISINGDVRTYDFNIIPLKNRQGTLTGRVVMLHDITALKRANEELVIAREQAEEANRLKSQFLATMSHELRTPLNAIIGFTEILLSGMGGVELSERANHMIDRIHANSKELLALINDVLDLAKIEARRVELVKKPFSPADLIRNLYSEMESLVQQKGLTFELTLADDLPAELIGDSAQVKRVITNLLSNAIKFTPTGGVTLKAEPTGEGRAWTITVADTGIGIPPHALGIIFDPFRQVDDSARRAYGGTGLGLAITRELVVAMGGDIQVESALEKGSTFVVTLPVEDHTAQRAAEVTVS